MTSVFVLQAGCYMDQGNSIVTWIHSICDGPRGGKMVTSVGVTSGTMLVGGKVIRMFQKAVAKRKKGYRRAQSSGTKAPCNRMLALLSFES